LRFSSLAYTSDYTSAQSRAVHLTNQSVQKHVDAYGSLIESNMWNRDTFHDHLNEQLGEEGGSAAAAQIEAQMHAVIGAALRGTHDVIEHRPASFALFGFDFLLDADRNVWLLEVNSSPDMSTSAAPLQQIVNDGLDDVTSHRAAAMCRCDAPLRCAAAMRPRGVMRHARVAAHRSVSRAPSRGLRIHSSSTSCKPSRSAVRRSRSSRPSARHEPGRAGAS
jgi:hypothetical protein